MSILSPGWKAKLQRTKMACPVCAKVVTAIVILLCSASLALAVECIWKSFQEFRDAVNKAAFAHARKVFEQRNPGQQWNPRLLDSDNDGVADPLQSSYYTLSGNATSAPYACSEFSAYVHNVLQKEFPQLQKGDIQTVWNHNHSIIRLRDGLICDGAQIVDGYRYVEPQGMRDEGAGTGFTRTLETAFDDPNPIRSGINNPNWFYDGPQGSAGRSAGGGGGGIFGGGNGVTQGLMSMLLNSLMRNNGQPEPKYDDTLQRLKDSFQPSPTPIVPTPTPLPTSKPVDTPQPPASTPETQPGLNPEPMITPEQTTSSTDSTDQQSAAVEETPPAVQDAPIGEEIGMVNDQSVSNPLSDARSGSAKYETEQDKRRLRSRGKSSRLIEEF